MQKVREETKMRHAISLLLAFLLSIGAVTAYAHSGGTDANGCHHDRKRGGYHCH